MFERKFDRRSALIPIIASCLALLPLDRAAAKPPVPGEQNRRVQNGVLRCNEILSTINASSESGWRIVPGAMEKDFFLSACAMSGPFCRKSALAMAIAGASPDRTAPRLRGLPMALGYSFAKKSEDWVSFPSGGDSTAKVAELAGYTTTPRQFETRELAIRYIREQLDHNPPRPVVLVGDRHDVTVVGYRVREGSKVEFLYHDPAETALGIPDEVFEQKLGFCLGPGMRCGENGFEAPTNLMGWEHTGWKVYTVHQSAKRVTDTVKREWLETAQMILAGDYENAKPTQPTGALASLRGIPALRALRKEIDSHSDTDFTNKTISALDKWLAFGNNLRSYALGLLKEDLRARESLAPSGEREALERAIKSLTKALELFKVEAEYLKPFAERRYQKDPTLQREAPKVRMHFSKFLLDIETHERDLAKALQEASKAEVEPRQILPAE